MFAIFVVTGVLPAAAQPTDTAPVEVALATLNHARSFDERSRAGSVVRRIDRGNAE